MTDAGVGDVWPSVPDQRQAVGQLRAAVAAPVHAYLFVGPSGSGARQAARAFCAELITGGAAGDDPAAARHRSLALADQHPDIAVVERSGPAVTVGQAREIVRSASLSPLEGDRKAMILHEFHLVRPDAAATLLKTIEEPPSGTFFVILAEEVTPELVTIASRCGRVDFPAPTDEAVAAALVAEGVATDRAAEVAAVAHGDLDRARLLATDERLAVRLAAWRGVPGRLDGSGHAATVVVDELRAAIDDALGPLVARHADEVDELQRRIERYGQRGSGARELEERHRREVRRLRTDELRLGFAELARSYRDGLAARPEPVPTAASPEPVLDGLAAITAANEALVRSPNEELLLLALFLRLPPTGY